ncbi:hypothetical protein D3C78_1072720 [compost metagenome]
MEKRHQHIQHQKAFGKRPQPVLLAEFDQQQVDRHVGHDVDGREPRDFRRPDGKRALQILQIGGHHSVTQRTRQADQQTHDAVGETFRCTM